MKTINPYNQEYQRTPSTRNIKKTKPRNIIIKLFKTNDKEKNLKAVRVGGGRLCKKKKKLARMTMDFLSEIMQAMRQ